MKLSRQIAQACTSLMGAVLFAVGVWVAYNAGGEWDLYTLLAMAVPMGASIALFHPALTDRTLATLAPYLPFLEDPEEDGS